ncbi:MAG: MotA/TolQ/ExbB proton channel family protein [Methylophilaceae bacterium]|nr:MotA/TolQ/ExbB proton channel family protein [Methylophilaceae bacterium]
MDAIFDIVDTVLWLLAALSILTWTILIVKVYVFWRLKLANRQFLDAYTPLTKVGQVAALRHDVQGTLSYLAQAALSELRARSSETTLDAQSRVEQLRQTLNQERYNLQTRLESGMTVLASIGSTSPFIGLFGTVWGIMHALKGISASGSAGLDVVAGPIGEALIATAMGIAAAIPAVLAYNFFLRKVRLSAAEMDHFSERLQLLAKRSDYKVD